MRVKANCSTVSHSTC